MDEIPSNHPQAWLARLAPQSAAAWLALGARSFRGETSLETSNGVYRFRRGVFVSRARRPARSFDAPKEMRGMRLIGFLADDGGAWSLSPRWRRGAHAVLWKPAPGASGDGCDPSSFIVTSPCVSVTTEDEDEEAAPSSGVQTRIGARPPSIRELEPPSMTRLHAAGAPAP